MWFRNGCRRIVQIRFIRCTRRLRPQKLCKFGKCGSLCSDEKVGDAVMGMAGNILLDLTSVSGTQLEVSSEGAKPALV